MSEDLVKRVRTMERRLSLGPFEREEHHALANRFVKKEMNK